jgi:hypothetical protein
MATKKKVPWKRPAPKRKPTKHLTGAQKRSAKRSAAKAGRPYPNLVDNMKVAKKAKKRAAPARKRKKAAPRRKSAASRGKGSNQKDPAGGLTAQGRVAFRRKQGSHLRPGVRRPDSKLTPEELRRKGSWAVRFYGRKQLPPLLDPDGGPTRYALTAHAWGEPVPKTVAAARRIAAKGRRLLEKYRRSRG